MEAVYPSSSASVARARRLALRRARDRPERCRTQPVTFAEIKEVDEERECAEEEHRSRACGAMEAGARGLAGTGASSVSPHRRTSAPTPADRPMVTNVDKGRASEPEGCPY